MRDLARSEATWKIVVSGVVIGQNYTIPYDRWEGYGAERAELLNFIRDEGIENVVFLTTDEHRNQINEVFLDRFADPDPIAWEFVTGPIATVTEKQLILGFGAAGPAALEGFQTILSLVGTDCRNLDAFSFGTVAVDAEAGTISVTLQDVTGTVIHDDLDPSVECTKTLIAEP
jgi:phosphodiesterase/alkaline phosphatase D-like protein